MNIHAKGKIEELLKVLKNDSFEFRVNKQHILSSIVFKLSKKCNLKCSYCYVDAKENRSAEMDLPIVTNVISHLTSHFSYTNQKKLVIYLHGGEPLLSFPLIKRLVEFIWINNLENQISLRLQTNGVLLNRDILNFVREYKIGLGVSLDGHTAATNCHRIFHNSENCFSVIDAKLTLCQEAGVIPGIISVIDHNNVHDIIPFFQYLQTKGVTHVVLNPLIPWGRAKQEDFPLDAFIVGNKQLFVWLKEQTAKGSPMQERNLYWLAQKINNNNRYMCMNAPCGAGLDTVGIDVDGSIYICDQFVGDERFKIGTIHDDLHRLTSVLEKNTLIQLFQNRSANTLEECAGCNLKYLCPMGCPAMSAYHYGSVQRRSPLCSFYREMIPFIIKHK